MTTWPSFETSGPTHPTEHHIPKHMNPHQHCWKNLKSHTVVLFCITCFMLNCFNFTLYRTASTFFLSFKNCFSPRLHTSYKTHNLVTIVSMTTRVQLTQPLTRVPTLLEDSLLEDEAVCGFLGQLLHPQHIRKEYNMAHVYTNLNGCTSSFMQPEEQSIHPILSGLILCGTQLVQQLHY